MAVMLALGGPCTKVTYTSKVEVDPEPVLSYIGGSSAFGQVRSLALIHWCVCGWVGEETGSGALARAASGRCLSGSELCWPHSPAANLLTLSACANE